jgi:hypothetical protein
MSTGGDLCVCGVGAGVSPHTHPLETYPSNGIRRIGFAARGVAASIDASN